jgi:hypothetical protein
MKDKRGSAKKVPQTLFRNDLYDEYHDLVTLLRKLMGLPTTTFFEEWMFYFIEEILHGTNKVHSEKMSNDNLHNQFLVVKMSMFYMTSYLVYLLVIWFPYNGLFCFRELGIKKGKLKVYDCYP